MSNNYKFSVPDMSCEHCKMRISNALSAADVESFDVDLSTKLVTVTVSPEMSAESVVDLIDTAGYDAELIRN
ncbi:MAG: heavy-metal-associated domain-containing protein [Spirochaetales bacterium]|nr:heavy-metal-associated domain-containing protein [Spirochaetales bacterium]